MTSRFLPTPLRRALEKVVRAARVVAEEGAADAVRRLGVAEATAPAHLTDEARSSFGGGCGRMGALWATASALTEPTTSTI